MLVRSFLFLQRMDYESRFFTRDGVTRRQIVTSLTELVLRHQLHASYFRRMWDFGEMKRKREKNEAMPLWV